MSVEYTIDIQLTELGFLRDTLGSQDILLRESPTSSDDSSSPCYPPNTQQLLLNGQSGDGNKTGAVKESAVDLTSPLSTPALSLQHGLDKKLLQRPVVVLTPLTLRTKQLKQDQSKETLLVNKKAVQEALEEEEQDEEDYSDDSDISGIYEEDDEDEEDEEEEEPNELGLTGDYSCNVCGLQLPSKFKLQDHMNLHTGARPYGCAECGKRFCQISNYRAHLRTHSQSEVKRFQCRVCRKSFSNETDLKCHVAISHWEDTYYECDQCKRVFGSLEACQYHVAQRECLQKICEKCGRNFASAEHLARHRRKPCRCRFKCTECKKIFTKKIALLKHSFSHLGLLPYTCLRCHCHFRLAKLYLEHKCEPGRIHCLACLREFPSEKDFQQHKKDTGCWGNRETKGDEIRCLECGERFDTSDELKRHAGAHQRVLKCAECSKGFRSALLLMSHMGGHAGNSPCLCQACGLGFPHQQNYNSHLKTCGQTPPPKSSAKKSHGHAGNSSCLCQACGLDFPNQQNYNSHLKTCGQTPPSKSSAKKSHGHAGNPSCLCQACGLGFPNRRNYNRHLKTCGQTPLPKSSAKKSHVSKRSSSKTSLHKEPESSAPKPRRKKKDLSIKKMRKAKPVLLLPKSGEVQQFSPLSIRRIANLQASSPGEYQVIAVQTNQRNEQNSATHVPVHQPHNPGPVIEGLSASVNPSSGLWELTLGKPLDQSEMVLFLPVCSPQTNGLTLPSPVAFHLVNHSNLEMSASIGPQPNAPLNMVNGIDQDPISDIPFDLSMKSALCPVPPPPPVKSELAEVKISVNADNSEGKGLENSNADPYHQVKRIKTDPMDLPVSSELITDIKKEGC